MSQSFKYLRTRSVLKRARLETVKIGIAGKNPKAGSIPKAYPNNMISPTKIDNIHGVDFTSK